MVDVFEEVDEQMRSQRVETLLRRGWPFAAATAGIVLIGALGLWGWSKHEADEQAKASVAYQNGLDVAAKGDFATAEKDFASVAASGPPTYRALALMQQAQIALDHKSVEEAVRYLDRAAKVAPDPIIGDAARLKAALILMDDKPLKDIEERLQPLTTPKAPYRALALEAEAMAKLQAGKLDEAKAAFSVLSLSQDVSQSAQTRARAAIAMINSGSAKSVGAVVSSAKSIPPDQAELFSRLAASAPGAGAAQ